jgi:stage III sporulation protein AG
MKTENLSQAAAKIWTFVKKNKFVMVVLLIGLVLILLPTGVNAVKKDAPPAAQDDPVFSLSEQEARIAAALSKIEGAGKVTVVLTLKCGTEQVLAEDESVSTSQSGKGDTTESDLERTTETVIISGGSSQENPVTLKYIYPEYLGALVVCEGADNAAVKYQLVKAVSGLTGLGADKIVVTKMNKS